jgi:DNA repair protein RadD
MKLRDYQERTISDLYKWFGDNDGHPCLVLPTGSGKSIIVAALCRDAIQNYPETRILMLTHVKELIEQNAEKMRLLWKNAPLGIYSASLRKKELGEPITFAGIQSIHKKHKEIGHIDLIIIDECHLISHKDEGGYRTLINNLTEINPAIRIIGLTATPYRLGHGLITDKPAIFDSLIEPVSIEELIHKKHLCTLKSKITKEKLSTEGVHKRGGEFIESELQEAIDKDYINDAVVDEVIALAGERKAWLFFCTGIQHAEHVKKALVSRGIIAECITGSTTKTQREQILADFKSGKIRALTNCNVLTTGFDYPDIDLIAMLRPTMSPGLYVQMAGRGLRPKSHTDHCLVLDFAGVVQTHGPITNITPPKKGGKGEGEAPVKLCEHCHEIVHISAKECPACGEPFPIAEPVILKLHNEDIMGVEGIDMNVTSWLWQNHTSRASGSEMVKVTYYGALSDAPVIEYLCINNEGYAGEKARRLLAEINYHAGGYLSEHDILDRLNKAKPPSNIEYKKDGKFFKIMKREWNE